MFHLIRQVFHLINLPVLLVDSQRGFVVQALMGNLKASPGCRYILNTKKTVIDDILTCAPWHYRGKPSVHHALKSLAQSCQWHLLQSLFGTSLPLVCRKIAAFFLSCKICNYTWLIRQVTRVSSCFASTSKRWSSHLLGWLPGICIEADRILKSKLIDTS